MKEVLIPSSAGIGQKHGHEADPQQCCQPVDLLDPAPLLSARSTPCNRGQDEGGAAQPLARHMSSTSTDSFTQHCCQPARLSSLIPWPHFPSVVSLGRSSRCIVLQEECAQTAVAMARHGIPRNITSLQDKLAQGCACRTRPEGPLIGILAWRSDSLDNSISTCDSPHKPAHPTA